MAIDQLEAILDWIIHADVIRKIADTEV